MIDQIPEQSYKERIVVKLPSTIFPRKYSKKLQQITQAQQENAKSLDQAACYYNQKSLRQKQQQNQMIQKKKEERETLERFQQMVSERQLKQRNSIDQKFQWNKLQYFRMRYQQQKQQLSKLVKVGNQKLKFLSMEDQQREYAKYQLYIKLKEKIQQIKQMVVNLQKTNKQESKDYQFTFEQKDQMKNQNDGDFKKRQEQIVMNSNIDVNSMVFQCNVEKMIVLQVKKQIDYLLETNKMITEDLQVVKNGILQKLQYGQNAQPFQIKILKSFTSTFQEKQTKKDQITPEQYVNDMYNHYLSKISELTEKKDLINFNLKLIRFASDNVKEVLKDSEFLYAQIIQNIDLIFVEILEFLEI